MIAERVPLGTSSSVEPFEERLDNPSLSIHKLCISIVAQVTTGERNPNGSKSWEISLELFTEFKFVKPIIVAPIRSTRVDSVEKPTSQTANVTHSAREREFSEGNFQVQVPSSSRWTKDFHWPFSSDGMHNCPKKRERDTERKPESHSTRSASKNQMFWARSSNLIFRAVGWVRKYWEPRNETRVKPVNLKQNWYDLMCPTWHKNSYN